MAEYSFVEQRDMVFVYGVADGNSHEARRIYAERYPGETMSSFDNNLLSMETLDRSSPELWPEPIPGVAEFAMTSTQGTKRPWMADLNSEDLHLLNHYNRIPLTEVITEVRRLQDVAYDLGLEEAKEMTRGKYLNILQRRNRR